MAVTRLLDYDTWVAGAQGATVFVRKANSTALAAIFSDEAATIALANPQTLLDSTINGLRAGKWAQPVYTNEAVEIETEDLNKSAIIRPPLTTLVGEVADDATVRPVGGDTDVALKIAMANVAVVVENFFGPLSGTDSASNTTKIAAAAGIVAANGGGYVVLPAGTYPFTSLNLAQGVVLLGQGVDVTNLTSQSTGNVIILSGYRAGLERLTLNGIDRQAGSVGVYAKNQNEIRFDQALIRSFDVGLHMKGAANCEWYSFTLKANNIGAKLHGDSDASGGGDGDEFAFNSWFGGQVIENIQIGVELSYEDKRCFHNSIHGVGFGENLGKALRINGAMFTDLGDFNFFGNTTDIEILDDDDTTAQDNKVIGFHANHGRINAGIVLLQDTCQDVIFEKTEIDSVTVTLTNVKNNVLALDCIERDVNLGGNDAVRWQRERSTQAGASAGITTNNVATKAWSTELDPGQVVYCDATVIGNGLNNIDRAVYRIGAGAVRPGSTLMYDGLASAFTPGAILTGATSGAMALITADNTTDTLTLREISGEFENNEQITDDAGGDALANGILVPQAVVLDTVGVSVLRTAYETNANWAATFVANGTELEVHVTGDTGQNVAWEVHVEVQSS